MGVGGQWAAGEGVVDGAHGFRVVKKRVICRKALPHYLLIFLCRHLEMYYYFVHLLRFHFLS
jgi:hypothetical protein